MTEPAIPWNEFDDVEIPEQVRSFLRGLGSVLFIASIDDHQVTRLLIACSVTEIARATL